MLAESRYTGGIKKNYKNQYFGYPNPTFKLDTDPDPDPFYSHVIDVI